MARILITGGRAPAALELGRQFHGNGHAVFAADSAMAIVVHHAKTPPPAPSASSELPIPPALDGLILACLAKSPADRPQSARALAQRLAEISGLNPWTEERAREWWQTHRPVRPASARMDTSG